MLPLEHSAILFDLHLAIIDDDPENQFLFFLRVAVLHKFYCMLQSLQ